ncbi:helix-turn-helix domain-containing protein [Microbacterium sp. 18062]|uniref:helix-turn-helix domain-containing protein n=1 Tax=Microbacterium sp. 18062 TaxID=2681410 RepID=UPI0013588C96|nr:helix-turn-helix domain-containing protein [Microbacterium sp. 18062]
MTLTLSRGLDIAARIDPEVFDRTRRAREAFLDGSWDGTHPTHAVGTDILQSWRRSKEYGIPRDGVIRTAPESTAGSEPLAEAARPLLDQMTDQCDGADLWGFVLDRNGTQILPVAGDRSRFDASVEIGSVPGAQFGEPEAGTNGAGLALVRLRPYLVVGHEHYQDHARRAISLGLPIRNALKRTQGVLVVCSMVAGTRPIIVPYALGIADAISERLAAATDQGDRVLFDEFLRQTMKPSTPTLVMSDRFCTMNAAAQQLLNRPQDLENVRDVVEHSVTSGRSAALTVSMGGDTYRLRCRALEIGPDRTGVIATLQRERSATTSGIAPAAPTAARVIERARDRGIWSLVRGEEGAGRAHLVRASGPLPEIDTADAAHDPSAWLDLLRRRLEGESLLVRNLDLLPAELQRSVAGLARDASSWCVATVGPGVSDEVARAFPVTVDCAPLRARKDEIPTIVAGILAAAGAGHVGCSPEVLGVLTRHDWPGNVSELRRVILNALVSQDAGRITLEHLPRSIVTGGVRTSGNAIDQMERELIFEALKNAGWKRDLAADMLGISRSTMYRKLRQFPFQMPSSRTATSRPDDTVPD